MGTGRRLPMGVVIASLVWASLFTAFVTTGTAQDEFDETNDLESIEERQDDLSPLLVPNWRGRAPRWIGMYGSQIADLVPEDYRPISIDELIDAIQSETSGPSTISEVPVSRCVIFARLVDSGAVDSNVVTVGANESATLPSTQARIVSLSTELILPAEPARSSARSSAGSSAIETNAAQDVNPLTYPLGPVNLAIQSPRPVDDDRPSFACGPDGELYATGRPGERVPMDWSLRCELGPGGRVWNMRLPSATTTEFFLSVGLNDRVQVEGGTATEVSLNELRKDYPDRQFDPTTDPKWVRIEPIPGRWILLKVSDRNATTPYRDVVRGCRMNYRYRDGQLQWTARLTIDRRARTPTIRWANGEVHSLQRDGMKIPLEWNQPARDPASDVVPNDVVPDDRRSQTPVTFSEVSRPRTYEDPEGYGVTGIRRPKSSIMQSSTMVLTFDGITPLPAARVNQSIQLPFPILPRDRFFIPPQVWQLQLEVPDSIVLTRLSLPSQWNVSKSSENRNPSSISPSARNPDASDATSAIVGEAGSANEVDANATSTAIPNGISSHAAPTSATWMATGPVPASTAPWSFSVAYRNAPIYAKHQVRLEMDDTSIETRAKITVETPAGSLRPILLELQDGFQFEFVGVGNARRNVTAQIEPGRRRRLTIWPVAGEAVDGKFIIYANARSRRGTNPASDVKSGSQSNANTANQAKSTDPEAESPVSDPKPSLQPLWVIRARDCPGQLLASIIPPTNLSWTAKAAIEPSRIDFSELTDEQRRFFAPLPGDAIVFGGAIESTPPLELESPDVDLAVSVRTSLQLTPDRSLPGSALPSINTRFLADSKANRFDPRKRTDPDFVYQTFEFKTEGTSGSIRQMKIRFAGVTGDASEMPTMQWSIQIRPGEREVPISSDQVTKQWNDNNKTWEMRVRLPSQHSNQSRLIGRSRQRLPSSSDSSHRVGPEKAARISRRRGIRIGLPNVPDAASQIAEVVIASQLQISRRDESLIGVPVCRYRYGTDDQAWVEVAKRDYETPKVLVVQEHLHATVSVSGADTLKLNCLARTESDLQLNFPRSLRLIEVRVNGQPVETRSVLGVGVIVPITNDQNENARDANSIGTEPPLGSSRQWIKLDAKWVSSSFNDRWSRWYTFPKISLNEMAVGVQQNLVVAPGTTSIVVTKPYLLGKLFGWLPRATGATKSGTTQSILTEPSALISRSSALISRSSALISEPSALISRSSAVIRDQSTGTFLVSTVFISGIGWIAAFLLLGIARMVGQPGLPTIGVGVVCSIIAGVLWPTTITAMIAFVAVPLTIAALQITASARNEQRISLKPSMASNEAASRGDDEAPDLTSSSLLPIAIAVILASTNNVAVAQNSFPRSESTQFELPMSAEPWSAAPAIDRQPDNRNSSADRPPVEVLVPLRKDGSVLGDKIYLPETFYNELFFKDLSRTIHDAMIHRADYRLRLRSINSLDFAVPVQGAATLTVDLAFRRPASLAPQFGRGTTPAIRQPHRIRLPYRANDVESVQPIARGSETSVFQSRRSVRHGRDENGWMWVEIPETEIIEIRLTLRCSVETTQPWVKVNAAVPSLAISTLTVQAERRVNSILLESPLPSSDSAVDRPSTPITNQVIVTDQASIVDPFAYDSRLIDLGPLTQLNVRFRVDEQQPRVMPWNQPEQWKTRYWVYVQPDETVVECEVEPLIDLPSQTTVKLYLTNPDVELLSEGWRLASEPDATTPESTGKGTETVSHLDLVRHAGRVGPIRLGWKLKMGESLGPITLPLPRVQVGKLKSPEEFLSLETAFFNMPADRATQTTRDRSQPWIAFSFSKQIQPDWSAIDDDDSTNVKPLAIDQFYSQWKGYLKSIDRVLTGDLRELTIESLSPARSQWLTRHEILIAASEQRIRYLAEVKPPETVGESDDRTQLRYSIEFPPRARLLDWRYASVGDDPVSPSSDDEERNELGNSDGPTAGRLAKSSWEIVRQGNRTWLYFDAPILGFTIEIDAVLPNQVPARGQKKQSANAGPKRLGLLRLDRVSQPIRSTDADDVEQVHDFQITRTSDVKLEWVSKSKSEQVLDGFEDAAALLTTGEVLVDRFTIDQPIHDSTKMATYRVRKLNRPFDVDSRITLRWEEGRWIAQMDCQVTSKHCPDSIDVAIPTRWCDSLQVDPLCVSSRQPTLDPALQVMRIELRGAPPETEMVREFRLRSRLAVSEIARVTVPEINVLGARRHRIDVVVPTRLTNEQVRWRSNFAGPIEKPRWSVESPMRMPEDSALSVYAVTAPTWSIDLEALPRTDRRAECLHADHKVIVPSNGIGNSDSQRAYLISRFDVLPGDQGSVGLTLSRSAKLIGVWAATKPSDLRPTGTTNQSNQQPDLVHYELPLPLNRLSQTIEVVTALDRPFSEIDEWILPQLEGLSLQESPATVAWCEMGNAPPSLAADGISIGSPLTPAERAQLLASSVVRAIASSSDALADRRDEEVATWLHPWISRYRMLAHSVGHQLGDDSAASPALDSDPANPEGSPEESNVIDRQTLPGIDQADIDRDGVLAWAMMDRFILNQEVRYFSVDDVFLLSDEDRSLERQGVRRASMWTDFLSVSNPPGYLDRSAFLWSESTLPVAELRRNHSAMTESTRQNVLRTGLFLALASLLLVSIVFKKNEPNRIHENEWTEITKIDEPFQSESVHSGTAEEFTKLNRNEMSSLGIVGERIVRHPAFWLAILALIGFPVAPLFIPAGLLLVTVVLVGVDPGYRAIAQTLRISKA